MTFFHTKHNHIENKRIFTSVNNKNSIFLYIAYFWLYLNTWRNAVLSLLPNISTPNTNVYLTTDARLRLESFPINISRILAPVLFCTICFHLNFIKLCKGLVTATYGVNAYVFTSMTSKNQYCKPHLSQSIKI